MPMLVMVVMSDLMMHYKYYDKFATSYRDLIHDETLYIDGILVRNGTGIGHVTLYLETMAGIDGEYMLHREDGPAYIYTGEYGDQYYFHYHGVNVLIGDLPCDDEIKLMLVLKYGNILEDQLSDYHYYGDYMNA